MLTFLLVSLLICHFSEGLRLQTVCVFGLNQTIFLLREVRAAENRRRFTVTIVVVLGTVFFRLTFSAPLATISGSHNDM